MEAEQVVVRLGGEAAGVGPFCHENAGERLADRGIRDQPDAAGAVEGVLVVLAGKGV